MKLSVPVVPMADGGEAAAFYLTGQSLQDQRLADRVRQALHATGYKALCAAQVTVRDQVVILKGHVPSYYLKQIAQVVAMKVTGMRQMHNDVQVVHNGKRPKKCQQS